MFQKSIQKALFEAFSTLPAHAIREIAVDSYIQLHEELVLPVAA